MRSSASAAEAGWVDDPPTLHEVRRLGWAALGGTVAFASYATYVVHPLVLTALMLVFPPMDLHVWPKFAFVAAIAVPEGFTTGFGLAHIPGLSKVL